MGRSGEGGTKRRRTRKRLKGRGKRERRLLSSYLKPVKKLGVNIMHFEK